MILNRSDSILKVWLPIGLFGVLWVDLVRELSFQWDANEQYAYGWFVPFLALALFWRRWMTRPKPNVESVPFWLTAGVVLLALFLLPVRVIFAINIDWPLPAWVMTMAVVGLSLHVVYLAGGRPWLRHFAFPICFILIAVPWPYRIEHAVTQGLMRVVAGLDVELLGWINIPAFQHGNDIEIGNGTVGVSEACSGIRSFQSTLMATLFLGELYQLKLPRRVFLLVSGVILAFCFNVARTFILTYHANSAGISAVEKWHDTAGMSVFLTCFACLWVIALLLCRNAGRGPEPGASPEPGMMPRRYLVAMGCWTLCILGLTDIWYRSHETDASGMFYWSASFPTNNPSFTMNELEPRTLKILRSDVSSSAKWKEDDGTEWREDYFRWNPGPIKSLIAARLHRPDICLPAAGLREVQDVGVKYFDAAGLKLPFREQIYELNGAMLHVFFCQWEDGTEKHQSGLLSSKGAGRLEAAMVGRLHMGQQTLEMILSGYPTLKEAEQALRKRLPDLIHITNPPAGMPASLGAASPQG